MKNWQRRSSNVVKKGLGKGLSALIPDQPTAIGDKDSGIAMIPISKIKANPDQPRKTFSKEALVELAASISENGIIQPLLLTQKDGVYYLIAGERRLRAAQLSGLHEVPAIIRDIDEINSAAIAIIENIQRENLSPLEESTAYQKLLEGSMITQEKLATKLGKSRTYITNSLRLLQLPQKVQQLIEEGALSPSHGRSILSVAPEYQEELAAYILKHSLNVRETENLVRDFNIADIRRKLSVEKEKDVHVRAVEETLERNFGTKVTIKGKHKGSITLDYYSKGDLLRITDLLLSK